MWCDQKGCELRFLSPFGRGEAYYNELEVAALSTPAVP
jgi:hypothetical protein